MHNNLAESLWEAIVPITLEYHGPLLATNDRNKRLKEKQEMRRQFHPQIGHFMNDPPQQMFALSESSERVNVGEFIFQPIICRRNKLKCKLDVTIYSRDPFGGIVQNADLDNRLKTLFDALRSPHGPQELPKNDIPGENESLFWVLLQDDSLITDLSVTSDILYTLNKTDVRMILKATVEFGQWTF